jgi:hypothetical protein
MLERVAILLILVWFAGVVSGYTFNDAVYIPLTIGILLLVARLVGARRTAPD